MNTLPFQTVEREILTKKTANTNPGYGCEPEKRPVEQLITYGVVNINKPAGPTSHQVSAWVQNILGINKSGHSGTLDPAVTGVLPIALGKATRIVQLLIPAGKEYIALMHLHKLVDEKKLKEVLNAFVGIITQLPPIKSAVKRKERARKIYYLEVLEIDGQDVLFKVGCEAGTYIRKLCHDIGQRLMVGAHMAELRRTRAGPFDEGGAVILHNLADAYWYWKNENNETLIREYVKPVEYSIAHLPALWVLDTTVGTLCHWADLKIPGISKLHSGIIKDETVVVLTLKNELIGIGTAKMPSEDIIKKDKGVAVKINKVFMEPGIYKIDKK